MDINTLMDTELEVVVPTVTEEPADEEGKDIISDGGQNGSGDISGDSGLGNDLSEKPDTSEEPEEEPDPPVTPSPTDEPDGEGTPPVDQPDIPEIIIPTVDYTIPDVIQMRDQSELYKFELLNRIMDNIRMVIEEGARIGKARVITGWIPTVDGDAALAIHNDRLYPQELNKIVTKLKDAKYGVTVEKHDPTVGKYDKTVGSMRHETRLIIDIFNN